MRNHRVQCPMCGALLSLPGGYVDCIVRCGRCHSRFHLAKDKGLTEQAVADWLTEEGQAKDRALGAPAPPRAPAPAKVDLASDVPASGNTAVLPAIGGSLRLARVDAHGVVLEFPASRLLDPTFRCAMPRCCLRCGARTRLHTHVVIFAPQFDDTFSLEAEHSAGSLTIQDAELPDLAPDQILARLPHVPNVPHPGDLPMPYWLCQMCEGASPVAGQIQVNDQTGEGWCRLLIGNLRRAEEFLITAGAADTPDHDALRKRIDALAGNPWDALLPVVQHRLMQWFHQAKDERFVAYIPDRDHFQSEDGMAGIVVSDRRLVIHTRRRHNEVRSTEPMELKVVSDRGKSILELSCPTCQVKHFCLDGEGIRKLHRAFASAQFNVTWR